MPDTPRLPPLPFAEAIAWARARQVVLPAVYYGELQGLVRAAAFTISGLTGLDQIQAVKESLTRVLESGETFRTWQQRIRDGEIPLQVGPAQIETIFRNNIQQSYNRGRYEQQMGVLDSHPWWMYDAVNDSRTRPTHAAMDGYVARHDDPIWSQWTPSCGHRCRCRRIALTADQAARYQAEDVRRQADPDQAKGRQAALIQGPDPGWGHDPYREPTRGLQQAIADRLARCQDFNFAAKRPGQPDKTLVCDATQYPHIHLRSLEGFLAAGRQMPPVRHSTRLERLSPQLAEPQLFSRFMREFGGESRADFTDVIGHALVIDRNLFLNLKGEWKMMKGERAPWLLYTAANIQRPDEIWQEPGRQGGPDKLYYLSRFDVGRRGLLACIAVFERAKGAMGAWGGRTNYATTREDEYIESKRGGEAELKYWRWER